jgi:hypothetical protein
MSPICIGSLPDFCSLFAFVFSLGCVYLCSHLPLMDGFPSLIFIYRFFLLVHIYNNQLGTLQCPSV